MLLPSNPHQDLKNGSQCQFSGGAAPSSPVASACEQWLKTEHVAGHGSAEVPPPASSDLFWPSPGSADEVSIDVAGPPPQMSHQTSPPALLSLQLTTELCQWTPLSKRGVSKETAYLEAESGETSNLDPSGMAAGATRGGPKQRESSEAPTPYFCPSLWPVFSRAATEQTSQNRT